MKIDEIITLGALSRRCSGSPPGRVRAEVLEEQFRGVPEADVCKLTSTNCARVFDLAI